MDRGIVYLLTGPAHGARLVVSLWSLRQFYGGPVTLYTTRPASHEIGERCAADGRLAIQHQRFPEAQVRRNSAFLTKLQLLAHVPYTVTAYLDADTLVVGPVDELLNVSPQDQFHATQFANWVSSGRIIRKRIERWRSIRSKKYSHEVLQGLVDDALISRPAVNGGVFAFHRDASLLEPWSELAFAG